MDVDMTMGFNDYQKVAHETAQYPDMWMYNENFNTDVKINYVYPALGLVGEAGEVAEKVKKIVRNKRGEWTKEMLSDIEKELGDVLWYVAELCSCLGLKMDDVAHANLNKLADRAKRNVIKSEGDDR